MTSRRKNKNNRLDSEKLAHLLRSNLVPPDYVYPAVLRPLRTLLRQRGATPISGPRVAHLFVE